MRKCPADYIDLYFRVKSPQLARVLAIDSSFVFRLETFMEFCKATVETSKVCIRPRPTRQHAVVLGFLGLALLVFRLTVNFLFCPVRALPGPWYTNITGPVLKYHIIIGRRLFYVHALHNKHGLIVRFAPREVVMADAFAAQAIHRFDSGFTKSA